MNPSSQTNIHPDRHDSLADCSHENLSALRKQFAALLADLNNEGDALADEVVHDCQQVPGETRSLLTLGMSQGVAAIPRAPESFRRFLAQAESSAAGVSTEELALASEPYLLMGPMWITVSLGPGSLVHTYADPGIAAVLMSTGNLSDTGAARRLLETQIWNLRILRSGGLRQGGQGYVQTLQVRLLHARVRKTLMDRGWTDDAHAVPINQAQMIRTWLDFTLVGFRALQKIGFEFSADDQAPIYLMWRLVGELLGIDSRLLSLLQDAQSAGVLLDTMDAASPAPNEHSRLLTRAMLNAVGTRLARVWGMPQDMAILFTESLSRAFHGEVMARQLGLSANWTEALLPVYADANRYRHLRAKQDPVFRRELFDRSLGAFDAIEGSLKGGTSFEHVDSHLSAGSKLPEIKV